MAGAEPFISLLKRDRLLPDSMLLAAINGNVVS